VKCPGAIAVGKNKQISKGKKKGGEEIGKRKGGRAKSPKLMRR
jgi:hypothetical protein